MDKDETTTKTATPNEIEAGEVKTMITKAVEETFKGFKIITPEEVKKLITDNNATLQKAIDDALKAQKEGPLTADAISKIAGETTKTILEGFRQKSGAIFAGDTTPGYRVEIPWGDSKGNLPMFRKQLFNLLKNRRNMDASKSHDLEGIKPEDFEGAMRLGDHQIYRTQKALSSTGANMGADFVPSDLSANILSRVMLESPLIGLLAAQDVKLPTDPFKWPMGTTLPTFYLNNTQGTAVAASTPGTNALTLSTQRFYAGVEVTDEATEDALLAMLQFAEDQIVKAYTQCWEGVILNGDDTATHMDSDIAAIDNDARKSFKGMRKLALAVNALKLDMSTGGLSFANIKSLLKLMGKYGVLPQDVVLCIGPNAHYDVAAMDQVLTVDKAGANATLFTGNLPRIFGVPIVTSAAIRENLNASGVYDGSTTTKGSIIAFNKSRFLFGYRRDLQFENERSATKGLTTVVASFRRGFIPIETPSATNQIVVCGYNYAA